MKFGAPLTRQSIACHGRSHVGLVRDENEDSFGIATDRGIAVVSDGMGGHENGRYVADCTVAALCQVVPGECLDETLARTKEALAATNRDVFRRAQDMGKTMGATLVAAAIDCDRIGIVWAGDSRAYIFRHDRLHCLTRDHSTVQDLLDAGKISPCEAARHPLRHVITRALGVMPTLGVESGTHALSQGDIVLLSSDGLHGAVSDDQITACLRQHGLNAIDHLIEIALDAGGRDNITIVLLQV